MRKYIGMTLLFVTYQDKMIQGQLKSFVMPNIGEDFNTFMQHSAKFIDKHLRRHKKLELIGVDDIFYVSGAFDRGTVLGKSFLSRIKKKSEAKKLIHSVNSTVKSQNSIANWNLISLIYFSNKTKETIACLTSIPSNESDHSIRRLANSKRFKQKLVSLKVDGIAPEDLLWLGVEKVTRIEEDPSKNGSFQILYKTFQSKKELTKLIRGNNYLLRKYNSTSSLG